MDVALFRRLLGRPGQLLLAELAAADAPADDLSLAQRFRANYDADLVAAAMTQHALRRAAREKFGAAAASLYFTRDGLEQATHRLVAAHRADRIAASGFAQVVDLCCGVGADLLAFASRHGAVVGVDRDPVTAAIASANLEALRLPGEVSVAAAESYPRPAGALVFADPARRGGAGRVFDPSQYSPPWPFVEELLASHAVVKVAPGIDHALVPRGVEAEWVSLDGRLREAVLWSEGLARTTRRASVLRSAGPPAALTGTEGQHAAVRDIGAYVYEPDDAVVRAHLVSSFADSVRGGLIEPHLAYVSSDDQVATRLGSAYRVVEVLPFKEKPLRAALRRRDIGALTIKKRGVDVTPEELRHRLRLTGSQVATLLLTRTPRSAAALLVDPLQVDSGRVDPP